MQLKNPDCDNTDSSENVGDIDDNLVSPSCSAIDKIIKTIVTNSSSSLKHGRLNPYYCSKLAKQFFLWTAETFDYDEKGSFFDQFDDV